MKKRIEARIRPRERMAKNCNGTSSGEPMNEQKQNLTSTDNGGRRSGGDRRTYSYTMHFPERRTGEDRRKSKDRRKIPRYRIPVN